MHAWDRTNVLIRTELIESESQWLELTGRCLRRFKPCSLRLSETPTIRNKPVSSESVAGIHSGSQFWNLNMPVARVTGSECSGKAKSFR